MVYVQTRKHKAPQEGSEEWGYLAAEIADTATSLAYGFIPEPEVFAREKRAREARRAWSEAVKKVRWA